MKKLGLSFLLSAVLVSGLSAETLADLGIEGLTSTNVVCEETGTNGFELSIQRGDVNLGVFYSSCDGGEIEVVAVSEEGTSGEWVTINDVEYYFPAGYTTPTVAANNTCAGGYDNTDKNISCHNQVFTELPEGYLNLTTTGGNLNIYYNPLTNVDGLSNLTTVGGDLQLFGNQLTNVDGLSNLTSVGVKLYLHSNQLTNVNGLSNLTSVGTDLYLYGNQLTNVDGLSNLTSVGAKLYLLNNQLTNVNGLSNLTSVGVKLALHNNPTLNDLSGLNNITSVPEISFDDRAYTVKMSASSWICQNYSSISTNTAKSNVCEE